MERNQRRQIIFSKEERSCAKREGEGSTNPKGFSNFQKSKKMTSSPPPGHWARISLAVKTQLMSTPPDLWLVSSEGYSLPTWASLLTLHSPLLKTLLLSSTSSPSTSSSSLSLPVPALPLSLLLSLLSEGSVSHHQPFNPLEVSRLN